MTNEERAVINAKIEQLWNTAPAVIGDYNGVEWKKFERARNRLFKKLGPGCRYCGGQTEFFMLRNDLWHKVVGVEPGRRCYGAGYVCLACVADRLFPRQLYDSDFGEEGRNADDADAVRPGLNPMLDWTDPETGHQYEFGFAIAYPNEGAEPVVKIETMTEVYGGPEELWDVVWDQLFEQLYEHIDWVEDYCQAHGLKLFIDGEEQKLGEAAS